MQICIFAKFLLQIGCKCIPLQIYMVLNLLQLCCKFLPLQFNCKFVLLQIHCNYSNGFSSLAKLSQCFFGRCNSVAKKISMEHLCKGRNSLQIRCKRPFAMDLQQIPTVALAQLCCSAINKLATLPEQCWQGSIM